MKIQTYVNSVAAENSYLLTSKAGAQLLIDPGSDLDYLADLHELSAVLLTHAHFDHLMGLSKLAENFQDLAIYLSEEEKDWPEEPDLNLSRLMMGKSIRAPRPNHFYELDELLEIADFQLELRATPGHSIGSVSLISPEEKVVFSGDALFRRSIGRTDLPTGNFEQLKSSIREQLFSLPDDFQVFPGHGESTTIGQELEQNPFFKD